MDGTIVEKLAIIISELTVKKKAPFFILSMMRDDNNTMTALFPFLLSLAFFISVSYYMLGGQRGYTKASWLIDNGN